MPHTFSITCCVPNCGKTRLDGTILHMFPNPEKDPDRFRTWLYAIGGDIIALENKTIFKYRRVCHHHFQTRFHTTSNRLCANAVPTLNLPGFYVTRRTPLPEVGNINIEISQAEIPEEINLCKPSSSTEHDFSDHNYTLQPTFSSTEVQHSEHSTGSTQSIIVIGKCTTVVSGSQKPEIMEIVPNQPISTLEPVPTDLIHGVEQTENKKPPKRYFVKRKAKLTSKCRCFMKRFNEMTIKESKKKRPFLERYDAAKKLSLSQLFIKNFDKMTHQAQDFLLLQLIKRRKPCNIQQMKRLSHCH